MIQSNQFAASKNPFLGTDELLDESTAVAPIPLSENLPSQHSILPASKFVTHHPKSGLNPLVDCAAYLFSIIGKLKLTKSYRHLNALHKELIQEINLFQQAAKTQGYSSEYILVSRFALCVTFDDVIANTSWGNQGHWDNYSLLSAFNQDATHPERFFLILEQISKDPAHYIDVMEFMYICLSLGFKGSYRATEYSNNQLENITHTLYKTIRAYKGDFSKMLSPFQHSPTPSPKTPERRNSIWFIPFVSLCIILSLFIGFGLLLNTISNETYQELMHIGKALLYEIHE